METKDVILQLRTQKGLSQDELAERILVTRQAVSRWENGETVPNTETLKLLSKEFDVSINTLLGAPRQLVCQCCGMPLEDAIISHNKDGSPNEDYCKWCYADGTYTYSSMDDLIDACVRHMTNEHFTEEQARAYMRDLLPTLEQAGIPTAYFEVSTFEDYLAMLEVCTRVTGRPELYEQYGEQVRAQVDAAVARAEGKEGPSVLYLRATGSSCKVKNSENSVLGEMLAALGCVNIADSDASLLEELSMEAILAADPERIFIVMQGSDQEKVRQTLESAVLSNPAWQQLSAVKNGRVYYMDQQLYNLKPNARWGEAYEKLAEILYGEA